MKFKANTPNTAPMSPREETQRKYNNCRANLLVVVLFTIINLFTLTFGNSYFLFSATLPALFPTVMSELAADTEYLASMGILPEEASVLVIVGLVIGLILTVPYLLCWIFSKKRVGWMVAALVFFSVDSLLLLLSFDVTMIPDILIHAWVMFYLITGVKHGFKLKTLPEDEPLPEFGTETPAEDGFGTFNEADFAYTADNAAPAEETAEETAAEDEEPVAARSFDEIMAENNKDEQ